MNSAKSFAAVLAGLCAVPFLAPSSRAEYINSTSWTQTEPGAGGAFVAIGAGPTGIVLAASDLAGSYLTSNPGGTGATWSNIGSFRGVTYTHNSAVGFDPSNSATMFIGTEHGLFRSTDTGATFSAVGPNGYWTSVVLAPSAPTTGLAAFHSAYNSINGVIYKTTDSGATWTAASATQTGSRIQKIVINPTNSNVAYYLAQNDAFTTTSANKLFQSTDGGVTWAAIGGATLSSGIDDFDLDPATPSTLYCTKDADGTYKSTDSGLTWTKVGPNYGVIRCKTGGIVRVIKQSPLVAYESTDAGVTWTQITTSSSWHVAYSPTFSYGKGYAYCKTVGSDLSSADTYYWASKQYVYRTTDGGANWYPLFSDELPAPGSNFWRGRGISNAVPAAISVQEVTNEIVYIGFADLGLWRSTDHGDTWQSCNEPTFTGSWNGKGGDTLTVVADPDRDNVVWASMGGHYKSPFDARIVKSTNYGQLGSWSLSNGGLPTGGGDVQGLSVDDGSPTTNRTLFVTVDQSVYKSTDDGANWTQVLTGAGNECSHTAVDRTNGSYVFAGGVGGFFRSTDGGTTWTKTGLTAMTNVQSIHISDADHTYVFAACFGSGKGLYRSTDSGATWTKILTDDDSRSVSTSRYDKNIIYHASSAVWNAGGPIGTSTGIKRSTDGGATWTTVNDGLAWPLGYLVHVDHSNPYRVFIASPGNGFAKRMFP